MTALEKEPWGNRTPGRMNALTLPNFILIGSAKCATTSFHHYLRAHPDIFMTRQKELHFFIECQDWGTWHKGLQWYAMQFKEGRDRIIRGESSPGYSEEGYSEWAAAKMADLLPDLKLAYLMRDPLIRLRSQYIDALYFEGGGNVPASVSLDEILSAGPDDKKVLSQWYRRFVYTSLYFRQLSHYLRYFPLERICLITAESLAAEPTKTLNKVCSFLGVGEYNQAVHTTERYNETTAKRKRFINPMAFITRLPGYERISQKVPYAVKNIYHNIISRKLDHEHLSMINHENAMRLRELFSDDINKLQQMTGLSFREWTHWRSNSNVSGS